MWWQRVLRTGPGTASRWIAGLAWWAVPVAAAVILSGRWSTAGTAAPPAEHWAQPVVRALQELGIIPAAHRFAPDAPLAATDWAAWLCAAAAWPEPAPCPRPEGDRRALPSAGHPVTRGDALAAAAVLATAVWYPDATLPPDAAAHPRSGELLRAFRAGISRGYPDGTLRPGRPLSEAEAAVILGRLLVNRHESAPWRLAPAEQTPLDRLRLRLHPELAGPHSYVEVRTAAGRLVAGRVRVAATDLQRRVGAESGLGEGLLLTGTAGIHTRWGPVPLDVAFLDGEWRVTAVYTRLPRNQVVWGGPGTVHALELPGGTIAALGLRPGDRLQVTELPD